MGTTGSGGAYRSRTGVPGFADPCLTTRPTRHENDQTSIPLDDYESSNAGTLSAVGDQGRFEGLNDQTSIAWAAGLFEGEGAIYFDRHRFDAGTGHLRLGLTLSSTDEDVLRKFWTIVGVGTLTGPYWSQKSTKPYWVWQTRSTGPVAYLTTIFRPFLGKRRLEKLDAALVEKEAADLQFRPKPKGPRRARPLPGEKGLFS
jgi:hypothetical protein